MSVQLPYEAGALRVLGMTLGVVFKKAKQQLPRVNVLL